MEFDLTTWLFIDLSANRLILYFRQPFLLQVFRSAKIAQLKQKYKYMIFPYFALTSYKYKNKKLSIFGLS